MSIFSDILVKMSTFSEKNSEKIKNLYISVDFPFALHYNIAKSLSEGNN